MRVIKMKIQVWSDFRCPFCYIGKTHLDRALKELNIDAELEFMSYELDRDMPQTSDVGAIEGLAQKYGISIQEARDRMDSVVRMAKDTDLHYDFDNLIDVNSFNAHRVLHIAKQKGLGNEFAKAVMSAHLEHGKNINDAETLVALGESVGLSREDVTHALEADEVAMYVRQEQQLAQMVGVKGVPFFLIDGKLSLSGAQPVEVMKQALNYAQEMQAAPSFDGPVCEDGSCDI